MKPSRRDVSYSVKARLLHLPLLGGEEQVAARLVVAGVDDRLDALVGRQRQQVDDGQCPGRCAPCIGISCAFSRYTLPRLEKNNR